MRPANLLVQIMVKRLIIYKKKKLKQKKEKQSPQCIFSVIERLAVYNIER